ncbi:hypothetical protein GLYMA_15G127000v4 [Glycine max]|uniref:Uncharacterized protein n=1 Tax=Glycine max TaxID=3847 RepID=A0A0R0G8U2_SOYBN|nr:hypothetical protein GYH30_042180 [Glycine max]KRH11737.1 hypothetical protein GLYMA_15G127000v4 [Glycine max]
MRLRLVGRHANLEQKKILNSQSKGRFPKQSESSLEPMAGCRRA